MQVPNRTLLDGSINPEPPENIGCHRIRYGGIQNISNILDSTPIFIGVTRRNDEMGNSRLFASPSRNTLTER